MKLRDWFRRTPKAAPRAAQRAFDGARLDRLTSDWLGAATSIDADLRAGLARIRQRSRDLAQNNDYVRRFLGMVARGVVGPSGFRLHASVTDRGGVNADSTNRALESAFDRWSRTGICETGGRLSFAELCRLAVRSVARDGEILIREVTGSAAGNEFGYALQLIDPVRLDGTLNVTAASGRNRIEMGVELDVDGRAVAYWITDGAPADLPGPRQRTRVPASSITHLYIVDRPEQTRGVPWLHTAMVRLHHLKGYDEAAVIAARIGASKMGIYTMPDGNPSPLGDPQGDGTFMQTAEPGEFSVAPSGYTLTSYDPAYPHDQYQAFVKACLRGIASGLDISYSTLANDLEGVNFSSIRSGTLDERDQWMALQDWFAGAFLAPLYDQWLKWALLNRAIVDDAGAALPIARYEDLRAHEWQGRRWQWVDPLKDITANVMAIQNHLASPQQIAAQSGRDLDDVLADLDRYRQMLEAHNLPPPAGTLAPVNLAAAAGDGG